MPVKLPILQKKHIGIIGVVAVLAVLIGTSPWLFNKIQSSNSSDTQSSEDLFFRDAGAGTDSYIYRFPVVLVNPIYYFPFISFSHSYFIQPGTPIYISNFAHPESGCNWIGVAGQVFDENDSPILGDTLVVSGTIGGQSVSLSGRTGTAPAYGIGGYEIKLAEAPFSSSGTVTLFLLDSALKPKADPVPLTTHQSCEMNVVLINFYTNH